MATFIFREELEQASLEWRLRKLMKIHLVVNVDALSFESGLPANEVRSLLEAMMARHEVERLRPVGYNKDDMDFFLLYHLPRAANGAAWQRGRLYYNWRRWIENAKLAVKVPVLRRRQSAYA
ncbi:MAG: hypothetical protein ABIH24_08130 [Verrucomicrobiota bacterium]